LSAAGRAKWAPYYACGNLGVELIANGSGRTYTLRTGYPEISGVGARIPHIVVQSVHALASLSRTRANPSVVMALGFVLAFTSSAENLHRHSIPTDLYHMQSQVFGNSSTVCPAKGKLPSPSSCPAND